MIKPIGQSFFESASGIQLCDAKKSAKNVQVMKKLLSYEPFAEMIREECGIDPKDIKDMEIVAQKNGTFTIHLLSPDHRYQKIHSISVTSEDDPLIYEAASFLVQKSNQAPQFPSAHHKRPSKNEQAPNPYPWGPPPHGYYPPPPYYPYAPPQQDPLAQKAPATDRAAPSQAPQNDEKVEQLQETIAELEQRIKERKDEIDPLQRELNRLKPYEKGYDSLRTQIQQLQAQTHRDRATLNRANQELQTLRPLVGQYNDLYTDLQEAEDEIAEMEEELENVAEGSQVMEEVVDELTDQVNESQATAAQLQTQLNQRTQQVGALLLIMQRGAALYQQLQQQLAAAQALNAPLQQQLTDAQQALLQLEQQRRQQVLNLAVILNRAFQRNQQLQQEIRTTRAQLAEARDQSGQIQDELEQTQAERAAAQDALRPLQQQLDAERAQRQDAERHLAPVEQARQVLQQQFADAQARIDQLQQQLAAEQEDKEAFLEEGLRQAYEATQAQQELRQLQVQNLRLSQELEREQNLRALSAEFLQFQQEQEQGLRNAPRPRPDHPEIGLGVAPVRPADLRPHRRNSLPNVLRQPAVPDAEHLQAPFAARIEALQRQVLRADENFNKAQEEIAILRPLSEQVAKLTEEIATANRRAEHLERQFGFAEQELILAQQQNQAHIRDLDRLREELAAAQQAPNQDALFLIDPLTAAIAAAEQQHQRDIRTIERLRTRLTEQRQNLELAQQTIQGLTEERQRHEEQLHAAQNEVARLQQENDQNRQQLAEQAEEMGGAQVLDELHLADLQASEARNQQLVEQLSAQTAQNAQQERESSELSQQLRKAGEQLAEQEATIQRFHPLTQLKIRNDLSRRK